MGSGDQPAAAVADQLTKPAWDLSCPDWQDRIRAGRSLIPPLPLDGDLARKAVGIFNYLRLPDVPGTPKNEEAAGDWFRQIVAALFGSFDTETQRRMIREIFLMVAKKNNKTTGGAGLMMTALMMNERPRAEFLLIGPTHAISDLAYQQAVGMIEADDGCMLREEGEPGYLKRRFHLQDHLKQITDRRTKAKLKIKTFDLDILTGPKPAGVLLDEVHLLGKHANASRVVGQLRGGMISNPEAFMVMITTESDDPPAGLFRSELVNARMVRDGRGGPNAGGALLPILYEFPDDIMKSGRWRDPKNWHMVNPNLDRSITLPRLIEDWEKAQRTGEDEVRRWASQHLNIEIGLALRSDAWAGAEYWEACADKQITLDYMIDNCDVICVGIDGGGLDDLLGFAAVGRHLKTRKWLHWGHAWAYSGALERRKENAPRLQDFKRAGELTIFDEMGDDVTDVVDLVMKIERAGLLPEKNAVGVDPVGISEIVDALEIEGITVEKERIVGIKQGWTLSNTFKTTERRLASRGLTHAGQGIMAWAVGNAKVEPRGNAIAITKQAAGVAKIDPLMALFNAVALMAKNPMASRNRALENAILGRDGFA